LVKQKGGKKMEPVKIALEGQIKVIYITLDVIRELLRNADEDEDILSEAALWLAHIDSALLNKGGYYDGPSVTAEDTLYELKKRSFAGPGPGEGQNDN
jgi:hypothetical protein